LATISTTMSSKDSELYAEEGVFALSFFRKLLIGSLATLHNRIEYPVIKKSELVIEKIPMSIGTGSKQWVIDKHELKDFKECEPAFLNGSVDKIPSGWLTPKDFALVPDEALNDNITVIQNVISKEDGSSETVHTRVKNVPVSIGFTLKIRASSLSQALLISESMIELYDDTMEFRFSHLGLDKLVAQIKKEEGIGIDKKIPIAMAESAGYVEMEFNFVCISNYPKLNRYNRYKHLIESGDVNVNPK